MRLSVSTQTEHCEKSALAQCLMRVTPASTDDIRRARRGAHAEEPAVTIPDRTPHAARARHSRSLGGPRRAKRDKGQRERAGGPL